MSCKQKLNSDLEGLKTIEKSIKEAAANGKAALAAIKTDALTLNTDINSIKVKGKKKTKTINLKSKTPFALPEHLEIKKVEKKSDSGSFFSKYRSYDVTTKGKALYLEAKDKKEVELKVTLLIEDTDERADLQTSVNDLQKVTDPQEFNKLAEKMRETFGDVYDKTNEVIEKVRKDLGDIPKSVNDITAGVGDAAAGLLETANQILSGDFSGLAATQNLAQTVQRTKRSKNSFLVECPDIVSVVTLEKKSQGQQYFTNVFKNDFEVVGDNVVFKGDKQPAELKCLFNVEVLPAEAQPLPDATVPLDPCADLPGIIVKKSTITTFDEFGNKTETQQKEKLKKAKEVKTPTSRPELEKTAKEVETIIKGDELPTRSASLIDAVPVAKQAPKTVQQAEAIQETDEERIARLDAQEQANIDAFNAEPLPPTTPAPVPDPPQPKVEDIKPKEIGEVKEQFRTYRIQIRAIFQAATTADKNIVDTFHKSEDWKNIKGKAKTAKIQGWDPVKLLERSQELGLTEKEIEALQSNNEARDRSKLNRRRMVSMGRVVRLKEDQVGMNKDIEFFEEGKNEQTALTRKTINGRVKLWENQGKPYKEMYETIKSIEKEIEANKEKYNKAYAYYNKG